MIATKPQSPKMGQSLYKFEPDSDKLLKDAPAKRKLGSIPKSSLPDITIDDLGLKRLPTFSE